MDQISNHSAFQNMDPDVFPDRPNRTENPVQTLADLLAAIDGWTHLPLARRTHLTKTVQYCVRVIARNMSMEYAPASAFPAKVEWLNGSLFKLPAKAHRLTKRTLGNYVIGLREALRHSGILHDTAKVNPPKDGPWAVLLGSANCTYARVGLSLFAEWCAEQGILPDQVDSRTLEAFERFLVTQRLQDNIRHSVGNVAKSWRRLIRSGLVQASVHLVAPNRRKAYTLPLSAFPERFQQDVAQLIAALSPTERRGPFRGDGPPKPFSARTVRTRVFGLRQAASALVILGRDIATITSLADLVEVEAFDAILTYYWERAIELKICRGELAEGADHPNEAGVTVQTGSIAAALMMVARYHVKVDAATLEVLRKSANDVRPEMQAEINPKTRKILNELSVPSTRLSLLHLPNTLMKLAEDLLIEKERRPARPQEAARLAMIATAIKIELLVPLRIGNLHKLRVDTHLQRFDPRTGLISLLSIPKKEVKNSVTIEWPVDRETGEFIEHYLRKYRPLLNPGDSVWLFPSGHGERTEPRSEDSIRRGITDAIRDHVGIQMHVHAFRAFLAMLLLEDSSSALEDLRLLLGHKTLVTAQRYYTYVKPALVATRVASIMDRARAGISTNRTAEKLSGATRQWAPKRRSGR